jgi:hypothetical protein
VKKDKNSYFFFDCSEMSFYFTDNILEPDKARLIGSLGAGGELEDSNPNSAAVQKELQLKFDKFLEGQIFKVPASAIFSIIINSINLTLIRDSDLTVCFNSISGKRTRISLVDYITCLLSRTARAPNSLIVLHNYLKNVCLIPFIFIKNEKFLL